MRGKKMRVKRVLKWSYVQIINDSHMTNERAENTYRTVRIVLTAKTTTHTQQSDLNCYVRLTFVKSFKTQSDTIIQAHSIGESCKIPQLHRKSNPTGLVTRLVHTPQMSVGSIVSVSKSTAKYLVFSWGRLVYPVDFRLFLCCLNIFSELCRFKNESSKFQVFTELGEYHVFFEIRIRGIRVLSLVYWVRDHNSLLEDRI